MSTGRTLIVHAGGGKAGSSAIQSALWQGAEALSELGITYANAPAATSAYSVTSGNGLILSHRLSQVDWKDDVRALLDSYLGENPVGVCSSEFLGSMSDTCWRRLLAQAEESNIQLKVIFFVRSAVDYVIASYNQEVKRGGESRTFDEAAPETTWQHYEDLQTLHSLFWPERLRVVNYDRTRTDLIGAFIDAAPELRAAEESLRKGASVTVNRSLTPAELDVMRRVNRQLDGTFGEELSDLLIYDAPELRIGDSVSKETVEVLAGKFESATAWVNAQFFKDDDSALVRIPAKLPKDAQDDKDRPLNIAFDWALGKIRRLPEESLSFVRERLLEIDWHNAGNPLIPPGFDPIAYLMINLDVMKAKSPPYMHFIQSGHTEQRQYRWPISVGLMDGENQDEAIARLGLDNVDAQAPAPVFARLRHFFQLEALFHRFAEREKEYLEEIRKLRQRQGFENEQIRQALGPVRESIDAISEVDREQHARLETELQSLRDGNAGLEAGLKSLRDGNAGLEAELKSLRDGTAGLEAELKSLRDGSAELDAALASLRADRERLSALIEAKDAQLAERNELLRRYRKYGFVKFVKWGLRIEPRP